MTAPDDPASILTPHNHELMKLPNARAIGPLERSWAAEHTARRARLFGGGAPKPKQVGLVRHILVPPPAPIPQPEPDPDDLAYAPPTVRRTIDAVCVKHGISRKELLSMSRRRDIILCRQECCYALRNSGITVNGEPISLTQIARHLGGLDHTTVLYSIRKHGKLIGAPLP